MSNKTKIVVLKSKDLLYLSAVTLLVLLLVFFLFKAFYKTPPKTEDYSASIQTAHVLAEELTPLHFSETDVLLQW